MLCALFGLGLHGLFVVLSFSLMGVGAFHQRAGQRVADGFVVLLLVVVVFGGFFFFFGGGGRGGVLPVIF